MATCLGGTKPAPSKLPQPPMPMPASAAAATSHTGCVPEPTASKPFHFIASSRIPASPCAKPLVASAAADPAAAAADPAAAAADPAAAAQPPSRQFPFPSHPPPAFGGKPLDQAANEITHMVASIVEFLHGVSLPACPQSLKDARDLTERVIAAMTKFPQHKDLQSFGCDALFKIVNCSDTSSIAYAQAVMDAGGTECVVATMEEFPHVESVQRQGCDVLGKIAEGVTKTWKKGSFLNVKKTWKRRGKVVDYMADAGGVKCVFAAMVAFPQGAGVQQSACATLRHIAACGGAAKKAVVVRGGIKRVVAAMAALPKDPGVQRNGCGALSEFARGSEQCRRVLVAKAGGSSLWWRRDGGISSGRSCAA